MTDANRATIGSTFRQIISGLLILLYLFAGFQQATAQVWDGPGAQAVSYPVSGNGATYLGKLGDGSGGRGGVAPAIATAPAEIVSSDFTKSDWYTSSGAQRTVLTNLNTQQSKVRFNCNQVSEGRFDIILNPNVNNSGHRHTFVGHPIVYTQDTYAELRASGYSRCPGGPLNRTAYWEPSVCKDIAGPGLCSPLKAMFVAFYYATNRGSDAAKMQILPPGLAFIGGVNTADYTDAARKAEVPAGFTYITDGFIGWKCLDASDTVTTNTTAGGAYSRQLKNADGSDPWGGNCGAGKHMWMVVNAPQCWDGKNLTSPNGRDHFRYMIRFNSDGQNYCPNGWYEVPAFEAFAVYSHNGFSDYGQWYLASDRMDPNPANWKLNGSTAHFDWKNGWEPDEIARWLARCIGVTVDSRPDLVPQPSDCNYGTTDASHRLISDSTSPDQVNLPGTVTTNTDLRNSANSVRFFPIQPLSQGDVTVPHNHTMLDVSQPWAAPEAKIELASNDNPAPTPAANDNAFLPVKWSLDAAGAH